MSKRYLMQAAREDRVAVLPASLQVGREVWYWRELLCGDDICPDGVTSSCPLNHGIPWYDDAARECARQHPSLEHTTIWSVAAYFTPRGIEWAVNDLPAVADCHLRRSFFRTREEAEAMRPGRIVHG